MPVFLPSPAFLKRSGRKCCEESKAQDFQSQQGSAARSPKFGCGACGYAGDRGQEEALSETQEKLAGKGTVLRIH